MADDTTETDETPDGGTETAPASHGGSDDGNEAAEKATATTEANQI